MLKAGLTGGLGSGKTYVCRIFESLGIPVYYSDDRAKLIMHQDQDLISALKATFGNGIYQDNVLDRAGLAAKVFNNKEELAKLNALVHPAVFKDTERWLHQHADAPYTIREAALIFETGSYLTLDKIITVTSPLELRLERAMVRDSATRETLLARIANQMDEAEKVKRSDYVIYNDNEHDITQQVLQIDAKLRAIDLKR